MTKLLAEVRAAKNIILLIDEVHTLVGAGSVSRGGGGGLDIANLLKPALARCGCGCPCSFLFCCPWHLLCVLPPDCGDPCHAREYGRARWEGAAAGAAAGPGVGLSSRQH